MKRGPWDFVPRRWPVLGLAAAALVVLGVTGGCGGGGGGDGPERLQLVLTQVGEGFDRPNYVTSANDGTRRLFVVEQGGTIRIIDPSGQVLSEPFLDLSDIVVNTGEAGLLSVAFHPDYGDNGRLFVYFVSDRSGSLRSYVAEFHVSAGNANRVDPATERVLIEVEQGATNHNAGLVTFGPDGYLWCSLGDGGTVASDAQDLGNLLGALLRIDVDRGDPYGIPGDNPLVGRAGAREEIFAYGFRNPWRYSIDHPTGRVFVGDVGQNQWEEIDLVEAGGNYGWPIMEGPDCFPPGSSCDTTGLELPIYEYSHDGDVCAVTGGYVYRGDRHPSLRGVYFFADYCSGVIYRLTEDDGQWQAQAELETDLQIPSFGTDEDGEMYVVDIGGGVYRMDFEPAENG
ncbi:MAG: PQQ-dependent sugar dehydrogenase [Armatimonadota bacterium]